MTVWIVWEYGSLLPLTTKKVKLITASKERAYELAAASVLTVAEEHQVEDMS